MSIAMDNAYDEERTYEDGKQYSDDKKLLVRFDVRAVKNLFQTEKQGRAIYDDVEYIEIIVPGSREVSAFPMDEGYKRRFKERYTAWKNSDQNRAFAQGGTILAELPWMTKSQIAELTSFNIYTVEQLAEMDDTNALKFMGNHQLRDRAKNFLKAAAGEAINTKLQSELEARDNKIEVLTRQVAELIEAIDKLKKK